MFSEINMSATDIAVAVFMLCYLCMLGYFAWAWNAVREDNINLRDKLRAAYADLREKRTEDKFRAAEQWASDNGIKLAATGDGVRWSLPMTAAVSQADYIKWSVVFGGGVAGQVFTNKDHALSFLAGRLAAARSLIN